MKEVQEKRLIEHYEFGGRGSGRNIAALGFESGSIRALYWAGRKREERLRVKRGKRRLEVNSCPMEERWVGRRFTSACSIDHEAEAEAGRNRPCSHAESI
jgi:hypothetical protein